MVFAHGINASGADDEPLLRQWAAAGYVIAAASFPLSHHDAPGGATIGNYPDQPGDVSYVITAMLRLDHSAAGGFHDLLDTSRIGVVGHSLGAVTVLGAAYNSCCADRRIRAAVSIDGVEIPFGTGRFFTGPRIPLLLLHGDADQTVPYVSSQHLFGDAPTPKFFVTLHGAPHTAFRQANDATSPAPPWEPVIVASVLDFLNRYLKDQPGGLVELQRDATLTGVASLQAQPG